MADVMDMREGEFDDDYPGQSSETHGGITADSDGKAECPGCGGRFKVTAKGEITGRHKCTGEPVTTVSQGATKSYKPRKGQAPAKVRQLGVATLGAGIEWGAEKFVSRATGDPVPILSTSANGDVVKLTDLPDADAMIGPFINLMWPQLPPAVQKTIAAFAEHEDVIAAVFAWLEWGQQIKRYTDAVIEQKDKQSKSERAINEQSSTVPVQSEGYGSHLDPSILNTPVPVATAAM